MNKDLIISKYKELVEHQKDVIHFIIENYRSSESLTLEAIAKVYEMKAKTVRLTDELSLLQEQGEKKEPEIVCICGSGRFLKQMHEVEERLTLEGKIVLMIGVNTKDVARTENMEQYKPMLDELHLRKIDLSDKVFVVNVGGYIGESTRREINYSESHNKPIEYLEAETIGKNKPDPTPLDQSGIREEIIQMRANAESLRTNWNFPNEHYIEYTGVIRACDNLLVYLKSNQ